MYTHTHHTENLLRRPARVASAEEQVQLRFYNAALHVAAFALPEFARKKLEDARVKGGFPPRDISGLP